MCRPVNCKVCGKTTWAGCGQHISSVKRSVAASDWCNGSHTPAQIAESKEWKGGFFARLFGR